MSDIFKFAAGFTLTFAALYLIGAFVAWNISWAPDNFFDYRVGPPTRMILLLMVFLSMGAGAGFAVEDSPESAAQ